VLARIDCYPTLVGEMAPLKVKVGASGKTGTPHTANDLPLLNLLARLYQDFRQVSIARFLGTLEVTQNDPQTVAPRAIGKGYFPGIGGDNGGTEGGTNISPGVHPALARDGVNPPTKGRGDGGGARNREK